MDYEKLCIYCMREKKNKDDICPYCGGSMANYKKDEYDLAPFTILNGRYLLGKRIGAGGFGITYLAMDLVLERSVAIKEFFMNDAMYRTKAYAVTVSTINEAQEEMYKASRKKFEREAKILAKLKNMAGIVQVYDFFLENGTSYIAMEYLEGKTLGDYVKEKGGCLSLEETERILFPIMKSLDKIHKEGILHRDISPDNIKFSEDGELKLFDFGGAKLETNDGFSKIAYMKPGYTPLEQYSVNGEQGPWTDVYAMGATIYYCICGKKPPEAPERSCGRAELSFEKQGAHLSRKEMEVLKKALELRCDLRYQSMEEFRIALENIRVPENATKRPEKRNSEELEKEEAVSESKNFEKSEQKKEKKAEEISNSEEKGGKNFDQKRKRGKFIWICGCGIGLLGTMGILIGIASFKNNKEMQSPVAMVKKETEAKALAEETKNSIKEQESEAKIKQTEETKTVEKMTEKQTEKPRETAKKTEPETKIIETVQELSETNVETEEAVTNASMYVIARTAEGGSDILMYAHPDENSDVILKLQKHNQVKVLKVQSEESEKWAYVNCFGCSGWLKQYLLEEVGNEEDEIEVAGKWFVSVEEADLKEKPYEESEVITKFKYGTDVLVESIENGWAKISYTQQSGYTDTYEVDALHEGYIYAPYISKYTVGTYVVNPLGKSLNIRSNPLYANWILNIEKGTRIQISKFSHGFGKIEYEGQQGWVMLRHLYLDKPAVLSEIRTEGESGAEKETETEEKTEEGLNETVAKNEKMETEDFEFQIRENEDETGYYLTEGKTDFQIDSVAVYDGSSEKVISSESEICYTYMYKPDVESKKAVEFLYDGYDGVFHVRFKEKDTGKQIDYYNIPLVEPAMLRFHEQDGYTYVTGWNESGNQLSNMEYYKVRTYDKPVMRKVASDYEQQVREQPDNQNTKVLVNLALGDEIEVCGEAKGLFDGKEARWYLVRLENTYGYISTGEAASEKNITSAETEGEVEVYFDCWVQYMTANNEEYNIATVCRPFFSVDDSDDAMRIFEGADSTVISSIDASFLTNDQSIEGRFVDVDPKTNDGVFRICFLKPNGQGELNYYNIAMSDMRIAEFHEENGYTYVTGVDQNWNELPNLEHYKTKTYDEPITRYVTSDSELEVREQPDNQNAEIITKVSNGDALEVCGEAKGLFDGKESDWYLIRLEKQYGYISASSADMAETAVSKM